MTVSDGKTKKIGSQCLSSAVHGCDALSPNQFPPNTIIMFPLSRNSKLQKSNTALYPILRTPPHGACDGVTASIKAATHTWYSCTTPAYPPFVSPRHPLSCVLSLSQQPFSLVKQIPLFSLCATLQLSPIPEIVPSFLNTPVRHYPLRQITDPPIYVMGDKMGHKAFPQQSPGPHQGGMPPVGMSPQAMIAQQNNNMEALERRRERERTRDGSASAVGVSAPFFICENSLTFFRS